MVAVGWKSGLFRSGTLGFREHEDLIESRIGIHDRNQFEIKLDYTIRPNTRHNRYRVETYFFIPRSLGIRSDSYTRDQFYCDVQSYIRFKPPHRQLSALIDDASSDAAFAQLKHLVASARRSPTDSVTLERCSRQLRLVGCLVRASIRHQTVRLSGMLQGIADDDEREVLAADLETSAFEFVQDLRRVLKSYRKLRSKLLRETPHWLFEAYAYVDEFMSLAVETHLTLLINDVDRDKRVRKRLSAFRQALIEMSQEERAHRRGAGYITVFSDLETAQRNERFVHHRGRLKKFVMSVLFLDISKERDGRRASHLTAATAAGTAMFFAALASMFSELQYGIHTAPFVMALVVTYIVKDRLKDILKQFFSAKMARWLWDFSVNIRDPISRLSVGRCRESFAFIDPDNVPAEVYSERHNRATSTIEVESKPEAVMKYDKLVDIRGQQVDAHRQGLVDINDIVRINISNFLVRMDDPIHNLLVYRCDTDRVSEVPLPKVYHINLVLVLRALGQNAAPRTERIRMVLDKTGIRRIETM